MSSEILKGNFKVETKVQAPKKDNPTLTDEMERRLMANLGGSVCYVKDKPFIGQPRKD